MVLEKLKRTFPLVLSSLLLATIMALPLGIIAGIRPFTWTDNVLTAFSLFGISAPSFWIGLMLIFTFAVKLDWVPTSGYGPIGGGFSPIYFVLPTITLSIQLMGSMTRFMRSGMLEVMTSDYIRTAHAKGLHYWTVVTRHALKNALLSVVTIFALDFGGLMTGSLITETVFRWPGLGGLMVSAIGARDYGIVQAVVLLAGVFYIFVNLSADVVYAYLDPRIRYQ